MKTRNRIAVALPMAVALLLCLCPAARAEQPLHVRIDRLIAAGMPDFAAQAAPVADDAEFLRRAYLDFTGQIPTVDQAREFLGDPSPDKRARLLDRLLDDPRFARHLGQTFDVLLMERRPDKYVPAAKWQEFLRSSFAEGKPYDRLVREVLSADGTGPEPEGAAKFYLDRLGEPHDITKDISRLFLGMNLQCAQCHDHPLVDAYKMEHYYGIYAFLNRSYLFTDAKTKTTVFAEKAEGDVEFESVFVPKVKKQTGPKLPDLKPVPEPELPRGMEYVVRPSKTAAGVPKFSRRDQLAGLLASADNTRFRRAAANRFWSLLMGRGLIEPVDFDHPANPPSHPELLDLLGDEFAALNYDVKAFLRGLALSETYQRSSRMPEGRKLPPEDRFALAQLRPLSPEQLAWSVMQATGVEAAEYARQGAKATEQAVHAQLARNVAPFVATFGGQPGDPADLGFQATLDQTLFLRNGATVRSWLAPRTGSLIHHLLQAQDADALAEELYLSVLTRPPTPAEKEDVARFLADNARNRTEAVQELAWALLASAEFRFNH